MSWPRFPALMHFEVERYRAAELGHVMIMRTRAMGMMELLTASFMPAPEQSLLFLLLDMIEEGNPSSSVMEKVLGKEGDERFFRTVVMPLE